MLINDHELCLAMQGKVRVGDVTMT